MAADLPTATPEGGSPTNSDTAAHSATSCSARVLSVSPHHVDQAAQSLQALIDQAHLAADKLTALLTHGEQTLGQEHESSIHLQERLRLGASMLKALGVQLGRADETLARFDDKLNQSIQAAIEQFQQQIAQRSHSLEAHHPIKDNLSWLSSAMHELAVRVEQIAADHSHADDDRAHSLAVSRQSPFSPPLMAVEPKVDQTPLPQAPPAPPLRFPSCR